MDLVDLGWVMQNCLHDSNQNLRNHSLVVTYGREFSERFRSNLQLANLDLQFIFREVRRICVGSDSPEYSVLDLRRRFDVFAENLEAEKPAHIVHKHLFKFSG